MDRIDRYQTTTRYKQSGNSRHNSWDALQKHWNSFEINATMLISFAFHPCLFIAVVYFHNLIISCKLPSYPSLINAYTKRTIKSPYPLLKKVITGAWLKTALLLKSDKTIESGNVLRDYQFYDSNVCNLLYFFVIELVRIGPLYVILVCLRYHN